MTSKGVECIDAGNWLEFSLKWCKLSVMAYQITGNTKVCSTADPGWQQKSIKVPHDWPSVVGGGGVEVVVGFQRSPMDSSHHGQYCSRFHGPLAKYVYLLIEHAPGMPGTFYPLLAVSFEVSGGENVPGIPSACTHHIFTYLARGPRHDVIMGFLHWCTLHIVMSHNRNITYWCR